MKKEYFKMILVLSIIAMICGFLLSTVRTMTEEKIEEQILVNIKGPAIQSVLSQSSNNPIVDRIEIVHDGVPLAVFMGKKDGDVWGVAFETDGAGYGGRIGVMLGIDIGQSVISGIGILTHQETPGLGSMISETIFTDKFKGRSINDVFKVKKDNGTIDAISGATNSSRGVCEAVEKGLAVYSKIREEITAKSGQKVE